MTDSSTRDRAEGKFDEGKGKVEASCRGPYRQRAVEG